MMNWVFKSWSCFRVKIYYWRGILLQRSFLNQLNVPGLCTTVHCYIVLDFPFPTIKCAPLDAVHVCHLLTFDVNHEFANIWQFALQNIGQNPPFSGRIGKKLLQKGIFRLTSINACVSWCFCTMLNEKSVLQMFVNVWSSMFVYVGINKSSSIYARIFHVHPCG